MRKKDESEEKKIRKKFRERRIGNGKIKKGTERGDGNRDKSRRMGNKKKNK